MPSDKDKYEPYNSSRPLPPPPRPSRIKGAFHLRPAQYPWAKAIRAGLTMGLCILLGAVMGNLSWGLLATVGGFSTVYVHDDPYPTRAKKLAIVGLGLAISIGIGTLTAGHAITMAVGLAVVSMLATFFAGAWRVPPPSGYFFILVCALGTGLPVNPAGAPLRMAFALLGAAIGWVMSMAGWLTDAHGPEELAVKRAYLAVANFLAADHHIDATRHAAAMALQSAEDTLTSARDVPWSGMGSLERLTRMQEQAMALFIAGIAIHVEAKGPISPALTESVERLAEAVTDPGLAASFDVPHPLQNTPARRRTYEILMQAVAVAAKKHSETMATDNHCERVFPLAGRDANGSTVTDRLRGALDPGFRLMPAVWRMGMTVFFATMIAHWLGNPRPYWVPLTCASVLQGTTVVATLQRTVQRALGTALGVVVGGAILWGHPPTVVLAAVLMILQFVSEMAIVRNYGVAVIFITPLPLILAEVGLSALQPAMLLQARLLDTGLGCLIGLVAIWTLWPRTSVVRMPMVVGEALRAEAAMLWQADSQAGRRKIAQTATDLHTGSQMRKMRGQLIGSLMNVRAVYDAAVSELPSRRYAVEGLWPAVVVVQRMGYGLLAAVEHGGTPSDAVDGRGEASSDGAWKSGWAKSLETIAHAVEQGRPIGPIEVPDIPNFPDIRREWQVFCNAISVEEGGRQ